MENASTEGESVCCPRQTADCTPAATIQPSVEESSFGRLRQPSDAYPNDNAETDDDDDGYLTLLVSRDATRQLNRSANERVPTTEAPENLGWRTLFICSFTTIGGFIFGYDIGVIGGVLVMDSFRDTMKLPRVQEGTPDDSTTANKLGWVVAILSLGAFFGSLFAGNMADKKGRKFSTIVGGVLATVGGAVQASAASIGVLYFGRFVTGAAIGVLSATVPLYNAEVAPKHVRGSLVALQQLAITFGIMVAFLVNLGVEKSGGWRVSLWLQCASSLVLLCKRITVMCLCPVSRAVLCIASIFATTLHRERMLSFPRVC
eukprot:m.589361 g.589361  ORF g.589361 m.589361 type:complete len:317 (-) comp22370_c0_seq1:142-1092(-)